MDVFVRTLLTYGAPVWAPLELAEVEESDTRRPLGRLAVVYRQSLRALLGVPGDVRTEVLYVLSLRWPLTVVVAKAVWRYYARIRRMVDAQESAPIVQAIRWAVG